ncbi:O-fucosyltransferase family protein [Striga hermonthica]|uniref:O-fucosyltransferase family protein n=1 Tax=Striga hermonthica TaxID=68872 RepID=A0A9N7RFA7_STRHE|nr:O-fucosyltransferase family protein [Striga hermonthica]
MDPERERRNGKCLLSPKEVALLLRALGFGHEAHIYVASGQIYGGKKALAPLKALFPNIHTKETLASNQELSRFSSHSSRMAALDFIVSDESDVLVTNNNGNMAKILAGRRRYFGHKPTIRPNTRKLNELFVNRKNMTWDEFSSRVRTNQIGFMGDPSEANRVTDSFHENPFSCICRNFEPFTTNQIRSTSLKSQVIPPEYDQDSSEVEYSDDD